MSKDINPILAGWEFDPQRMSVRIVAGDGREKLQVRIDLGIMQMELQGRPDGERPEDCDSWLDYYRQRQVAHDAAHPDSSPFRLDSEDCARLLREGLQYYHRYVSFWHLERYEWCARDTSRNLKLFEFVREFARHEKDKLQFDQWRPYVIMMHTKAVATPLVELDQIGAAIGAIDAGIAAIKRFLDQYHQSHRANQVAELMHLEQWRHDLLAKGGADLGEQPPQDRLRLLRAELERAVAEERFEDATEIRNEIHRINEPPPPETGGP